MAANNSITLVGRVGRDPEHKTLSTGTELVEFTMAVNRNRKDKEGNYPTDWFDIKVWGKRAGIVQQYVTKGSMLSVEGELQFETWEQPDGTKRKKAVVNCQDFSFLSIKNDNAKPPAPPKSVPPPKTAPVDDFEMDDLPPF